MDVAFAVTFGIFLALMAVLVVFVVRFAVHEGRRRKPPQPELPADLSPEAPTARSRAIRTEEASGQDGLDEASPAALVDDPDEGGDS